MDATYIRGVYVTHS